MKLWLLRPISTEKNSPWEPWYDKAFGFVVRAETELRARKIAQEEGGDECGWTMDFPAWTDRRYSTCFELDESGDEGVVMKDFRSA